MNKANYALSIATIILAVALIGVALTNKTSPVKDNTSQSVEVAKSKFMGACVDKGTYAYCECAFNGLIEKLGLSGFIQMSLEYDRTNQLNDTTLKVVSQCLYLAK